jgi:DNA-binding transcriptional regulator YdaS (Cro superfamily)
MITTENTGISDAISAAGSQEKLAELLGCSQQNVSHWRKRGWVATDRAAEVEQVTGVPRSRLVKPKLRSLFDTATI